MTLSTPANVCILGWPPEPINGEMIRRGLLATNRRGGFLPGLVIVLMSPWNVGFWLAVISSQPPQSATVRQSLGIAVVFGALTWGVVLCTAVKLGAHVLSHPSWQVATEAIGAGVMLWFAIRLLLHFP
jgi:threonine/homoserine/homoserine lactone efflux protein